MQEKTQDTNLKRLRQYIADESERLEKRGEPVVHCVNLDDVDEEAHCVLKPGPRDPLERDLDLLFGSLRKHRKH